MWMWCCWRAWTGARTWSKCGRYYKPIATSLRDAREIFRLARAAKVPVFSSSGLRFAKNTQAVRNGLIGRVEYAETYGPCSIEPHHPACSR